MDGVSAFLAQYMPSIALLVVGYALVVVEMYIPGFGVPGIAGIISLILGIVLAKPSPLQALFIVLAIVVLLGIALFICIHTASKGRFAKSKMILRDVSVNEENAAESKYMGKIGITLTVLRPAGMAEIEDEKVNVVSNGDFIAAGTRVLVDKVEGNRILVKPIK